MTWRVGSVHAVRDETPAVRTLVLDVTGWPGHLAGQHVDVRLTAPDGYTATRSYSIASAPGGERVELTVERIDDGEVSPYLTEVVTTTDRLELRGPVGGWFVWRPAQTEPLQLVAGGAGIVPLMAMLRTHTASGSSAPVRMLYGVRTPDAVIYHSELQTRERDGLALTIAYSRATPEGHRRPPGRVTEALLAEVAIPPEASPTTYVCGPTGFVETVADHLVRLGHDPARVRTERFGPSGGSR